MCTLLGSLLLLLSCSSPQVGERSAGVIPAPIQLTKSDGTCPIDSKTGISYSDPSLRGIAEQLSATLGGLTGLPLPVAQEATERATNRIHLSLTTDKQSFADLPAAFGLSAKEGNPADENYMLSIQPKQILIQGTAAEGVFRGASTLRQLASANLDAKGETCYLPVVEIKDGPRFAWRGLSFDVSRCFFTPDEVKQVIDMMSLYKMNVLHLHLSDNQGWRIEIKKYPKLAEIGSQIPNNGRKGGYYTQEEFKELVRYANERFITIVPEVDLPGHTAAVFAAYPEFKNAVRFKTTVNIPGQAFNALDVDDPKAMQFTKDVIAELAALTPGGYLHIGGDEAVGLPHDKFVRYVNQARAMVKEQGKRSVGWQETARADIQPGDLFQHWIHMKFQADTDKEKKQTSEPQTGNDPKKTGNDPEKTDNDPFKSPAYREIMALYMEFMKEAPKDPALGISKGAQVILSPSGYVYLDHRYLETSADSTQEADRERLGMRAYADQTIQEMYEWDPMTFNPTVEDPRKDVAGIEAAIWCETISNFKELQFLLMPRLAGVAEKGWSQVEKTNWEEYRTRLVGQAPLWRQADWYFFQSSLVDWK